MKTIPLRHLADVRVSTIDKKSVDDETPVRLCNYTDVYYQDMIDPATAFMDATASDEQIRSFALRVGDTLLTKDSETPDDIAVPAFVAQDLPGVVSGYHLALVRPDTSRVDPAFLYRAIQSDFMREQFSVLASGVTRYGLTHSALRSAEVPFAIESVAEQRRIADFLDDQVARLDDGIALRRAQSRALNASILSAADEGVLARFVQRRRPSSLAWADSIPEHWPEVQLRLVARIGTGHTPSRSMPEYWLDCDIPWLTTTDVKRFRRDQVDSIESTMVEISSLGLANSAAVMHPKGTVGLCRTSASAGFSIVMDTDMATSQDFVTWTPGAGLRSHYLLWCLRAMRRDLLERLAMGSTHKTIYFPDLEGIRIPWPSLEEQDRAIGQIRGRVATIRQAQAAVARSTQLLTERKRALITAAVTGEFDVTTASGRGVA